jgi:hypothetical protein
LKEVTAEFSCLLAATLDWYGSKYNLHGLLSVYYSVQNLTNSSRAEKIAFSQCYERE